MNRELGTKWFVFFTKVRPCLACLLFISSIVDFAQYTNVYIQYWWMMLTFIISTVQVILCVMVAVKSRGDYREFVNFVKMVLLFETFGVSYKNGVTGYINSGLDMMSAIIYGIVALIMFYFVWYRLNVKYFQKRLLNASQLNNTSGLITSQTDMTESEYAKHETDPQPDAGSAPSEEPPIAEPSKSASTIPNRPAPRKAKQRYCKFCGSAIDPSTKKCTGCGKQYFKIRFKSGWLVIVLMAIVSIAAISICVYQFEHYQQELSVLTEKVAELESEVVNKDKTISEWIELNDDKNKKISQLSTEIGDLKDDLSFYDRHIVFVLDDNTNLYHKYKCNTIQHPASDVSFWAYNTEAAKSRGYKPCPKCCG